VRQRRLSTFGFPTSSAFEPVFAIGHPPETRRFLGHCLLALLGCLVLMVLGTASAAAAPKWSSSLNLVEPMHHHSAEEPQIALDAKGDAVAVWLYNSEGVEAIYASVRPASTGIWGAPVKLSTYEIVNGPHVAVDAEGEAVVIWEASNDHGASYIVQAATGSASTGTWQPAVNVSPASQISRGAELAVNAKGEAVTVWENTTGAVVEGAVGSAGAWQKPTDISGASPDARSPQVTIDSYGDAVAVWEAYDGKYEFIQGSTRPAGESWQAPVTLSASEEDARFPQVASDASGDVLGVWNNSTNQTVQSALGSAVSGTWGGLVNVSAPGSGPAGHQVSLAVNARGAAIASWGSETPKELGQAASGSAVTGQWQTPTAFTPSGERVNNSRVAIDPQGDALAVWTNQAKTLVESAAMPTGTNSFSAPVEIYTSEGLYEREELNGPQVAFGGAGIGVAVWENGEEDSNFPNAVEPAVQAAAYTGTVIVPVAPSVVTGPSSTVEQSSATVSGTVNPNGSEVTACYFEYGTSTSYESRATCSQTVGSGEARVAVSVALSGLSPGTTYHYRVVATNKVDPSYGTDETFTTPTAQSTGGGPGSSAATSNSTSTSTSSTGTSVGVATSPKAIAELLNGCSSSPLVLNDVYIQGARVAIRGSAAHGLVGKKVKILFNEGKQVATATVEADGQYTTTAPLPPAKIRDNLNTRYTAEVGKLRSVHLKLVRRLLLEPPKASGTTVTLTGQVTLPLTKPVAPVVVEQQLECGKTTIAKTFTPPASGRFHITVTVPANARAAIFRLTSKVAANKHSVKHGFTTFSLPLPVVLG
jgi:hypothetical protein